GSRGVFSLNELEKSQQVMRGPKIRHERERLLQRRTNLLRVSFLQPRVSIRPLLAQAEFLPREDVAGQEIGRATLQRLLQALDGLNPIILFGRQQPQAFVRQWTRRRDAFAMQKIKLGTFQASHAQKFITQPKANLGRADATPRQRLAGN